TVVAVDTEAGPLRRRTQPAYQYPSYQQPTYPYPSSPQPAVVPATSTSNYTPAATTVTTESGVILASAPAAVSVVPGHGCDEVNAKRAMRGLRPFVRDEGLTQAARACAQFRAERGLFGHTGNDFGFLPPGAFASSTGCAAYPASYGWMSCCVYENYTY